MTHANVRTRFSVSPAYGRDYKSAVALRADWDAGKDFVLTDLADGGRYVNIQDVPPRSDNPGAISPDDASRPVQVSRALRCKAETRPPGETGNPRL